MADKEVDIKLKVDSNEVDKGTVAVKSYAAQLRQAKLELVGVEQQFGKNSQQYKDAQNKVNNLKEAQEELNRASKPLAERFKELGGPLGRLGGFVDSVGDKFSVLKGGLGQLGLGFKSLGQAIISTGIGALVVILGGLIAAVVQAAKKFEPLQRATEKIGIAMDLFMELLKPITDFILNAVVGAMEGLAYAIAAVTGNLDEFNKKAADAEATAKLEKNLKQQESWLDANGDKYDQYTQRKMKANVDYNKKVLEINKDETLSEKQKQELKTQYAQKANREIAKADADRAAEIQKQQEDEAKKAAEDAKRRREDALNRKKADLDAQIELEVQKENTSRETLKALLDKRMNLELQDAKLSAAQKEVIRKRYSKMLEDALKEDSDKEAAKRKADRDKEAADLDAKIELEIQKENTSQEKLKELLDKRMAIELDNAELTEAQKELIREKYKKKLEDAINTDAEKERTKKRKELEDTLKALDGDGQIVYNKESEWLNKRMSLIDSAEAEELRKAGDNEEKKRQIKEYYAGLRKAAIDEEISREQILADSVAQIQDQKIANLAGVGQLLGQIAGKNKALQIAALTIEKGAAIAQVVISTGRAIKAFSASVAPLGPAGIPLATAYAIQAKIGAGIQIASIVAGAAKGISDINSAEKDIAKGNEPTQTPNTAPVRVVATRYSGGMISGIGTSQSDSNFARVSNGEFIVNARATQAFLPLLSSMNDAGNQPQFAGGGLFMSGKRIKQDAEMRLRDVMDRRRANTSVPIKTYVTAVDMTNQQQFQRTIKTRSTL